MTTFVALGDSITVGIGDPAPGGGWRGWAALLAGTCPNSRRRARTREPERLKQTFRKLAA